MTLQGHALKYGDNVDTDVITHGALAQATGGDVTDMQALARACMSGIDPDFYARHKAGDLIIAGRNFGCGSSREHAPLAIKAAEISCVIAKSFARIFYRNAINIGLPILVSEEAVDGIAEGDEVSVDVESGTITNHTTNRTFQSAPFPEFMQQIMAAGGMVGFVKQRLAARS